MPAPAKPAVANQILLEYNPAEYSRITKAVGFARLDLGRDATPQEVEDYVASIVVTVVLGHEQNVATAAAAAAVAAINRK